MTFNLETYPKGRILKAFMRLPVFDRNDRFWRYGNIGVNGQVDRAELSR